MSDPHTEAVVAALVKAFPSPTGVVDGVGPTVKYRLDDGRPATRVASYHEIAHALLTSDDPGVLAAFRAATRHRETGTSRRDRDVVVPNTAERTEWARRRGINPHEIVDEAYEGQRHDDGWHYELCRVIEAEGRKATFEWIKVISPIDDPMPPRQLTLRGAA